VSFLQTAEQTLKAAFLCSVVADAATSAAPLVASGTPLLKLE
jgi:hypothetical protein